MQQKREREKRSQVNWIIKSVILPRIKKIPLTLMTNCTVLAKTMFSKKNVSNFFAIKQAKIIIVYVHFGRK
jgi:hypothetical protein